MNRQNLWELANVISESVRVTVCNQIFKVSFYRCEVKDYKNDSTMGTVFGVGDTIESAADNYFRKINKKWLVFDAGTKNRREYSANIYQPELRKP